MTDNKLPLVQRFAPALPFLVLAAAALVAVYHILAYW